MSRTKFGLCAARLSAGSCRDPGQAQCGEWAGGLSQPCTTTAPGRGSGERPQAPSCHLHPSAAGSAPSGQKETVGQSRRLQPSFPHVTKLERTHVPISHLLEGSWGVCADSHKAEL